MNQALMRNMSTDELLHYAPRGESPWVDRLCEAMELESDAADGDNAKISELQEEVDSLISAKKRRDALVGNAVEILKAELNGPNLEGLILACQDAISTLERVL